MANNAKEVGMRRPIFHMTPDEARDFLQAVPMVHLAMTDREGRPILRTVHGVVVGDAVAFHGSPVGEKQEAIGRAAVVGAEEMVALIPSYFVDPERACPATTYYRSVQVHGTIEEVSDPAVKAYVLQQLMEKLQPEGGHVPIAADHPMYAKAVAGIQVLQVPFGQIDGKAKLGQNLRPEQLRDIVARLWQRGEAGDPRAIDLVRRASPAMPLPAFLQGPEGVTLQCHVLPADVRTALAAWDGAGTEVGSMTEALSIPTAVWVGAQNAAGQLVACLSAASDGRQIRILGGCAADQWDADGILARLTTLLLDHPALRQASAHVVPAMPTVGAVS
jgi:nitroimidazol reductase NimA-like FMN-containing flavoprotein (pyridoxamine 5'-phosphate oxidase superfamily)